LTQIGSFGLKRNHLATLIDSSPGNFRQLVVESNPSSGLALPQPQRAGQQLLLVEGRTLEASVGAEFLKKLKNYFSSAASIRLHTDISVSSACKKVHFITAF
jgi:hypothetical protein